MKVRAPERRASIGSRQLKGRWLPALAATLPQPLWRGLSGTTLLLPYYHVVSDEQVAHIKKLYVYRNVSEFTRDLEVFLASYKPVGLADVTVSLDGTRAPAREPNATRPCTEAPTVPASTGDSSTS
jgi:hypothetical protein